MCCSFGSSACVLLPITCHGQEAQDWHQELLDPALFGCLPNIGHSEAAVVDA